ncbi:annexin D3 [Hibiscus syriacus]|uniref:Annexin D3 n=1 Tax=Hibiscus syriacus TaxID=106335 RepID=A0A6A2YZP1_HIBSY|nr:blue copper protein 1a-like [Hibiscus syriacus]KAE8684730.1 annexin D3 [Hibiscus syriacus]
MASNKLFMLAIVVVFLPAMAVGTEYIVGDDKGWTINFDYQAWAKDKVFHLGDKLVFRYPEGYHNVFKVNGTGFKNCDILPGNIALTSGNDTVVLKTPGRKWYICGVANHCSSYGQKLAIFVQYPNGLAPPAGAPAAPSVPITPTEPWAPTLTPWAPVTLSVPRSPIEPWAPAPAPWTPWVPATPTEPWTPAPAPQTPWVPATPTDPWAPAPSPWTPWVPVTPTEPWAPTPAPWAPVLTPSVPATPAEP